MADPDNIIQKVTRKLGRFDLDVAIPNIPKSLKKSYDILREDAEKAIFRKLWEQAKPDEKINIETDMNYELESSRSSSRRGSRSRSSRGYSSYSSSSESDT